MDQLGRHTDTLELTYSLSCTSAICLHWTALGLQESLSDHSLCGQPGEITMKTTLASSFSLSFSHVCLHHFVCWMCKWCVCVCVYWCLIDMYECSGGSLYDWLCGGMWRERGRMCACHVCTCYVQPLSPEPGPTFNNHSLIVCVSQRSVHMFRINHVTMAIQN